MVTRIGLSALGAMMCAAAAVWPTIPAAQPTDRVVAANYPPLMIEADARRPGFAVEVLREAAMRAGREISIDFLPFERAKHVLLTEPATLMPALFKGKRNDDAFHWIAEIGRANLRFGALARPVNSLDEARDLQAVVVEIGTTAEALLDNHGFDNLIRVTSPEASARMLAAGRADAWILSDRLMRKTWADLGLSDALIFGDVVHETPIFLVASPTLPAEVSAAYRRAIEGMRRDGRFQQLAERYDFSAARP